MNYLKHYVKDAGIVVSDYRTAFDLVRQHANGNLTAAELDRQASELLSAS